ncbi:MAG: glycerophosphodiester phosphodiesterase family protein [Halobacteriales archaeon]|nr:glycerophosphodiester phosphodiesterase family protein [Halobacteriales archaeon]
MERTRRALLASCATAMLSGCLSVSGAEDGEDDAVMNIAHAGGKFLRPENTVAAVENAVEVGADAVEVDLRRSADGRIVHLHDETVDRTTDGEGRVDEMTVGELKELDAGYAFPPPLTEGFDEHQERYDHVPDDDARFRGEGIEIPTFVEVLDALPNDFPLVLDVKSASAPPERLAELLREYDRVENTVVGGFDDTYLEDVRRALPEVETGLGAGEGRQFLLTVRANEQRYEPPAEVLFPPHDLVRASFVERAQRNGVSVVPWTVNPRDELERFVGMGVDGVITDDPVLLGTVLGRW